MTYYNLSRIATNSTSTIDMIRIVNDELLLGGFGVLLLIGLFVTVLLSVLQSTESAPKSLLAASFVAAMVSYLLLVLGLLPTYAVIATTVFLVGSAVANIKSS